MVENILNNIIIIDNEIINEFTKYMRDKKYKGNIYCLYNEMFDYYGKDVYKLGMSVNASGRLKNYTTSYIVDQEFKYKSIKTNYLPICEKIVFDRLRQYRMKLEREFFKCDISLIKKTIDDVCELLNSYSLYPNDKFIIKQLVKNIPSFMIMSINKYIPIYYKNLLENAEQIKLNYTCHNQLDSLISKWSMSKDKNTFIKLFNSIDFKTQKHGNNIIENANDFLSLCNNLYENMVGRTHTLTDKETINKLYDISPIDNHKILNILMDVHKTDNDICHLLTNIIYGDSEFRIDLNIGIRWLDSRKDSLKKTIIKTYIKDIDYIIRQEINKGRGGKPTDKIFITTDVFKKICMQSKAKNAKKVRTFIISFDKIINNYKDHIINNIKIK